MIDKIAKEEMPVGTRLLVNLELWVIITILNMADFWASRIAFSRGAYESNPLMDKLIAHYGIDGLLVWKMLFMTTLLFGVVAVPKRWFTYALLGVALVYGVLFGWHAWGLGRFEW